METCSSSEDLIVKTRKPYTITKQRERWTDEEHNRFLEALKLYGRAWQRIEEHIGTKTAVQIRSHAQKFFTKLEKEALSKGLPLGQAHNIDIPPPRPKRKPSNPYPRKTCIGAMSSSAESTSSLCPNKEQMLLKNDSPIEKPAATESLERTKGASENGSQSEVLTLFKDAPCTSITSVNKSSGNSKFIRGFVPLLKEIKGKFVKEKASPAVEDNNKGHYTDLVNCKLDRGSISSQRKLPLEQTLVGPQKADKIEISSKSEGQCSAGKNNDSCGRAATCNPSNDTSIPPQAGHCNPDAFKIPSILVPPEHYINALMSSIHQIPCYTPCAPFQQCQDAQGPFINMSSTFSNLIISSLIQNPAAHAAASLAASFWPSLNGNSTVYSFPETCMDGIPATPLTPSPSMTAIAAATVAAATAWWATHGLFPLNHPLHTALTFASVPATTIPTTEANQTAEGEKEDKDYATQIHSLQDKQVLAPQSSDVQMAQLVSSKILPLQLSDSDDSGKDEMSHGPNVKASGAGELVSTPDTGSLDKARNNKKQDRSSCGSNTPSSSDETDMMLENPEETKEEVLEAQINHLPSSETNSRRSRSSGSTNDSWREVSEEGRLAFQALFSREVLPQSFSPPYDEDMEIKYDKKEKNATTVLVDLNSKAWPDAEHDHDHGFDKSPLKISTHSDDSVCMSEAGHGKLKIRRTGFKPYKRCSAEAKENRAAGDETSIKRIRLGEEAST